MPLETASYIHELDASNPAAPDLMADTDNHLRLIKEVLKNTFPNITGAVTANQHQLNSGVPIGGIIMWSGTLAAIPAGWVLCAGQSNISRTDGNGSINAPDLRSRFVIGAGYESNSSATAHPKMHQTGGSKDLDGTTNSAGGHTHSGSTNTNGAHNHGGNTGNHTLTIAQIPSHRHSVEDVWVGASGSGNGSRVDFSTNINAVRTTANTSYVGGSDPHRHSISTDGAHSHTVSTNTAGAHSHSVTIPDGRPPFYALAFIMKV